MSGVSRRFDGAQPTVVIRSVDLTIERGEYVSITGRSGSGKSTLLNLLGLLDRPTSGCYELDGVDVDGLSDRQRTRHRGRTIGLVFQAFHLLPTRSVLENAELAMTYQGVASAERAERAAAALRRVGLSHRLDARPPTLSGGERQRVAIARALAAEPSMLLADEPTGNLDIVTGQSILDLFDELHHDGITLVVVTHDSDVSAWADRQVVVADGQLHEVGTAPHPGPGHRHAATL